MELWNYVHHLFETDDGSLPDIFIENITDEEKEKIFNWVMSITQPYGDANVWSIKEGKDIPLKEIENPAKQYSQGIIESFRTGLEEFKVNGVIIPALTICIGSDGIEPTRGKGDNSTWASTSRKELPS